MNKSTLPEMPEHQQWRVLQEWLFAHPSWTSSNLPTAAVGDTSAGQNMEARARRSIWWLFITSQAPKPEHALEEAFYLFHSLHIHREGQGFCGMDPDYWVKDDDKAHCYRWNQCFIKPIDIEAVCPPIQPVQAPPIIRREVTVDSRSFAEVASPPPKPSTASDPGR